MIVQRLRDGRVVMDRDALAVWLERPAARLPVRGRAAGRDAETRRALYDAQAVADAVPAEGSVRSVRRRGPRLTHLIQVATRQTGPT